MKNLILATKFILLAGLLIALGIGFIFFQVWQKNERPTVSEAAWDTPETLIGHQATLTFTVSAPWHREITKATPFASPEFLVPLQAQATFSKGSLGLSGHRDWQIRVPFVTTGAQEIDGRSASFPIKSTKRISPNSVTVPLPKLAILAPDQLPEEPNNPLSFLTDEKPPEPVSEPSPASEEPTPLLYWALLLLILIPLLIYLLKRSGVIHTTPAWEKALASLDHLDPQAKPAAFYSKLTDILKQYTSDRYRVRARAKTSREFIETLQKLPRVPDQYLLNLPDFATLADRVKFADHIPAENEAPQSLALIRSFVEATTPTEEEENPDSPSSQ